MIISSDTGLKYYMKYFFPHSEWIKIENHLVMWEHEHIPSAENYAIELLEGGVIEPEEMLGKN